MKPRRSFSAEFKAQVALEVLSGTKTQAEACREYQLKPEMVSKWKAYLVQNAAKLFETNASGNPDQARIAELERMVGSDQGCLHAGHARLAAEPFPRSAVDPGSVAAGFAPGEAADPSLGSGPAVCRPGLRGEAAARADRISMAEVGEAWQNGYAERLIRTIKEEEVQLTEYQDFAEAYAQIGQFLEEVSQRKRIHSALGYLTPAEFESRGWTFA
jgi:transposase-like protein